MRKFIRSFNKHVFITLIQLSLKLRYRYYITGLKEIKKTVLKSEKGTLFLPNHVALLDPLVQVSLLLRRFKMRPVLHEKFYYIPGIHYVLTLPRSLPVVDLAKTDNWEGRKQQYYDLLEEIIGGLKKGERFMFYPSGKIKRTAYERLEGASGAYDIVSQVPDCHVVLVNARGLWGSRFSYAERQDAPDLSVAMKHTLWDCMKSLLLFLPKRRVYVEYSLIPPEIKKIKSRTEFNRALEKWYNRDGNESIAQPRVPFRKHPKIQKRFWAKIDTEQIPHEIADPILEKLTQKVGRPVSLEDEWGRDLGLDSIEMMDIIVEFADELRIEQVELIDMLKVKDIFRPILELHHSHYDIEGDENFHPVFE
ncbi:1-acyl-sn-glycerol-3-phosphate acyltransferase [Candidatus Uabimicrobium amorphum]|uniref:1-acyl-sn-glycerol-3-phosphate acyltransferase n=1 Tax=Uabimicrobium amorphum TaxID=2596890 RepID=A0A5S9IIF8_UABAM|nr:1-acyl-sn-glycerol-3-phosphate acyltransferase [Candidatus Uabimicrobium amorphum]BBM82167.1 1-acyl-sn-glycerol-3-phosphate acyltransferase [Candidatus Uabimicrobium amorphum]